MLQRSEYASAGLAVAAGERCLTRAHTGRADGRVGIRMAGDMPRTRRGEGTHRRAASVGTRWHRGPSAPDSRSSRGRRAPPRRPTPGPVSASVVRRSPGQALWQCSCRPPQRRARTRTRAPPGRCTGRSPEARAARRDPQEVHHRDVRRPAQPQPGGCVPGADSRGPARVAVRRPARPPHRRPDRDTRAGTPPTSGSHVRPGSVAASPRQRGSSTDRVRLATADHAAAGRPTREQRPGRSTAATQSAQTSVPSYGRLRSGANSRFQMSTLRMK